ncbi:MAG: tyrosine-type recombinase/integrase [Verrucomicrobiota bacterium]|jgi:integrase
MICLPNAYFCLPIAYPVHPSKVRDGQGEGPPEPPRFQYRGKDHLPLRPGGGAPSGTPRQNSWKFVGRGKIRYKPIQGLQKEWERIREAAGLQDVRLHDLRHTYASLGVEDPQLSLSMIGGLLGHKEPRTTARYAHLSAHPMRKAANRIGARFLEAINASTPEKADLER